MIKRGVIIAVLVFKILDSGSTLMAQTKNISYGDQWWLRYYNSLEFSEKWTLLTEVDNRRFFTPDRQQLFLIRTQLQYNFMKKISVSAGIAYFLQNQHSEEFGSLTVPEIRPHQELNIKNTIGKFNISHRYKIEERFIRNTENEKLADSYRFNLRFRYQIGVDFSILEKLKLRIYDEILLNIGRNIQYNVFDQNRIYAGLKYNIIKSLSIEAGYMHWFQQRSSGKDFNSWDIVRVTIYHTISLSKKSRNVAS